MEVVLLKNVASLGLVGQVKKVSEGYARNFLFPKNLAKVATSKDVERFKSAVKTAEVDAAMAGSRLAALAQQIRNSHITIKKKTHDDGKLYGAVSAYEVLELLKDKGITVNKKQIDVPKAIKETGEHQVIVKLSSKVKTELTLKVVEAK